MADRYTAAQIIRATPFGVYAYMSTHPIHIVVKSHYLKQESAPQSNRFVFAYTISITNEGDEPVTLLNRYWYICDANDKVQEVYGEGVVGQQPRLVQGKTFTYTSGAVLETSFGTMEGHYQFVTDSGEAFTTSIPPFTLADRAALH